MNYNSSKNQKIKTSFVEKEVVMLASDLIRDLEESNTEFFDTLHESLLSQFKPYENKGKNMDCESCTEECHSSEIDVATGLCENCWESPEVFEYWFITDYFADLLEKQGEAIIRYYNRPIWGRTTTGQAIALDNVIDKVCEDLEILEGQRYSWDSK